MRSASKTSTVEVPLYKREREIIIVGDEPIAKWVERVVGIALIDADDAERVTCSRWGLNRQYAARWIRRDGKTVRVALARLILGLAHDDPRWADHINGDPLDNRRSNLRAVTPAQNRQNSRGSGSTGVKNVHLRRDGKYEARVVLGVFDSLDDAAAVVAEWRRIAQPFARGALCRV